MASGFEKREENDLCGLHWLHSFTWLRTCELGRLLRPGAKYARTKADRIARGWIARNLVIVRALPEGAGRALVLSDAGARFLRDAGYPEARTGKDWGQRKGTGEWAPPEDWRHDLIAAGLLADLVAKGYEILTERELRIADPNLAKVPDGLAWRPDDPQKAAFWIEVERARKSGRAMHDLAHALCAVANGAGTPIGDIQPTRPMVAFASAARDERAMNLNHRARVTSALQRVAQDNVAIYWAECAMQGVGVKSVAYTKETIASDRAQRVLAVLDASGWQKDGDASWTANYGALVACVWFAEDHGNSWYYIVERDGKEIGSAQAADNKTDAKLRCAGAISRLTS